MRKVVVFMMTLVGLTFAACGNTTNGEGAVDSLAIDSAVVDTLVVDSIPVDTVAVDTVFVAE